MSQSFFGFSQPKLEQYLKSLGKEKFRAQQLMQWVYKERVTDIDKMTNLSKAFRAELPEILKFELPRVVQKLDSIDGTRKFLFDVGAGMTVETVLIPNKDRLTICLSSEVGCNMACRFCYTGTQKLKKRLTTEQIVGQFVVASDSLVGEDRRITNIVFMGMGEPLDNCEAVFDSIDIITNDFGYNLSRKKITVSTSGLVPEMHRIWDAKVRLAVSLNASNDKIRDFVMPINKKFPLEQLLDACREYTREMDDKVTFEYVMLRGITDSIEHAHELKKLLRGIPCKINLIPFNEHPGSEFKRPSAATVTAFQEELMKLGFHVLVRRTMGRDIFAACGQLTSMYQGRPEKLEEVHGEAMSNPEISFAHPTEAIKGGSNEVRHSSSR